MMEKRILWRALLAFFGVMVLFTVLSRAVYQRGTAVVQTAAPTRGTVDHTVRLTGKTTQNQELAVTTLAELRVGAVLASVGQQVAAGDVLFRLDMDYLEEKIEEQYQELRKQQLSVQDAWSQSSAQAKQRSNARAQAEKNNNAAVSEAGQARDRAWETVEKAQKALDDYRAGASENGKQALEQAVREAEVGLTQAQDDLDALLQTQRDAIDAAIAQADTGEEPLTQEEKDAIAASVAEDYQDRVHAAREVLARAQAEKDRAEEALRNFVPEPQLSEQELLDALEKANDAYDRPRRPMKKRPDPMDRRWKRHPCRRQATAAPRSGRSPMRRWSSGCKSWRPCATPTERSWRRWTVW